MGLTRLFGTSFLVSLSSELRLRIEVPLWRDLTTAKHPTADLPAEEDSASDAAGSAERSPGLALSVPVGLAEPPEVGTEEATEDQDTAAEPNFAFAKGTVRHGFYPTSCERLPLRGVSITVQGCLRSAAP